MSKVGQIGNMVFYRPGGDCDKIGKQGFNDCYTVGSSRIYFFQELGNWEFLM